MHRTLSEIKLPALAELSVTHCRQYTEKDVLREMMLSVFGCFFSDVAMTANRLHKI